MINRKELEKNLSDSKNVYNKLFAFAKTCFRKSCCILGTKLGITYSLHFEITLSHVC